MADLRLAQPSEAAQIIAMLKLMFSEDGHVRWSDAKVGAVVDRLIDIGQGAGACIVVRNGASASIQGTLGMTISEFWFDSDPHLEMLWLFVDPAYRRSSHAADLIMMARRYADELGLPLRWEIPETPETDMKAVMLRKYLGACTTREHLVYNEKFEPLVYDQSRREVRNDLLRKAERQGRIRKVPVIQAAS